METIDDIRHAKLLILLDENKTVSKLAKKLGRPYAQVYQWIKRTPSAKSGKERTLLTSTARDIEIKCSKPSGWMDTPDTIGAGANNSGESMYTSNDINKMNVNELVNFLSDLNKKTDAVKTRLTTLLMYESNPSSIDAEGQKKNGNTKY